MVIKELLDFLSIVLMVSRADLFISNSVPSIFMVSVQNSSDLGHINRLLFNFKTEIL